VADLLAAKAHAFGPGVGTDAPLHVNHRHLPARGDRVGGDQLDQGFPRRGAHPHRANPRGP
jgi:hypothetical protein